MASKAQITKTGSKGAKAAFPKSPSSHPDGTGGSGVRVTPGAGGAGRIGPTKCVSTRAASNVREGAYGGH